MSAAALTMCEGANILTWYNWRGFIFSTAISAWGGLDIWQRVIWLSGCARVQAYTRGILMEGGSVI